MYIFLIFIAFVLIVGPIIILKEMKKAKKLEQEKAEGKWDFIQEEYLPYLQSHQESVNQTEQLWFKTSYKSKWWTLPGVLYYNAAGIYVRLEDMSVLKSPTHLFIWGKDKPSRFSPSIEYFFHSLEMDKNDLVLKLKTKENLREPDYDLIVKDAPEELKDDLEKVF